MFHPIIAVGASAGGLAPLRKITEALPRECEASVLVVMHTYTSSVLPEILNWHGRMPVAFAHAGDPVEAGHIHVAPPDYHMLIANNRFRLTQEPKVNYSRPSIDRTFSSVAQAYGRCAMGVILSGGGRDGAIGLADIKTAGGVAIVEDPREALAPDMPKAALAADAPECLGLEDIVRRVKSFCASDNR